MLGHVFVVSIIESSFFGTFVRSNDILTPEQDAVNDQGSDLSSLDFELKISISLVIRTAAFAMSIAKAKDPVSFGKPCSNKAASSSTPPGNTLSTGYVVPLALRSLVDMKGRDLEFHPLP